MNGARDASSPPSTSTAVSAEPPEYTRTASSPGTTRGNTGSSRHPVEHAHFLNNRANRPWLTLKVTSFAADPAHLPSFYEGEAIAGRVQLHLERDDTIKSVAVTVLGQVTTSVTDVYNFLSLSTELWASSMGDPAAPARTAPSKFGGRLRGTYEWPFSLALPHFVNLRFAGSEPTAYRLPPSFSERMTRVHIQYQLVVHVRRGKLRLDSRVGTVFAYTPVVQPDPPSLLRQFAYQARSPPLGPVDDLDGWHALPPVGMRGVVFNSRQVFAVFTLWLARPLCYTRGTMIPCALTMESEDLQALHLLAAPASVTVRLQRHIKMGPDNMSTLSRHPVVRGMSYESSSQDIRTACWWTDAHQDHPHASKRSLSGEIALPANLKPSCRIGEFELSYSVAVFPLTAVAYVPDSEAETVLQSTAVEIATAYPDGPRPVAFSPPGYHDGTRTSEFALYRRV